VVVRRATGAGRYARIISDEPESVNAVGGASCPTGSLTVSVKDRARPSKYAFGTKTAEFFTCAPCGMVPVVTSRIDGRLYAVVGQRSGARHQLSRVRMKKPA
jgi:hypothetical protein